MREGEEREGGEEQEEKSEREGRAGEREGVEERGEEQEREGKNMGGCSDNYALNTNNCHSQKCETINF